MPESKGGRLRHVCLTREAKRVAFEAPGQEFEAKRVAFEAPGPAFEAKSLALEAPEPGVRGSGARAAWPEMCAPSQFWISRFSEP